jgi:hypothetical protein
MTEPSCNATATAYKEGYYASGNLLFNVLGSLNVGVKYLYGMHEQKDGGRGHSACLGLACAPGASGSR